MRSAGCSSGETPVMRNGAKPKPESWDMRDWVLLIQRSNWAPEEPKAWLRVISTKMVMTGKGLRERAKIGAGGKRHIPVGAKQLLPVPRSYTNCSGISYSALFFLFQAPIFLIPPLYKPIQLVNTASSLASRQLYSLVTRLLCVFFHFALIYLLGWYFPSLNYYKFL